MPETVDIQKTQTLIDVVNETEAYKPSLFLSQTFFPISSEPIQSESFILDLYKGKRRVAPFVRRVSDGVMVENRGFETKTITPPYIDVYMVTTAHDVFKRMPGETPFNFGRSGRDFAARRLAENLMELVDMIHRRYEVMASQTLQDGKVTITGEGLDQEIDFLRDSDHEIALTGTDAWDDAASDPVADIREWKRLIKKNSGLTPDMLVLGSEAMDALLNNTKFQKMLDLRRFNNVADVNRMDRERGVTSYGFIEGVEVVEYNDWYINDVGTEVPYVGAKNAILAVSGAASQSATHFGGIADLSAGIAPIEMLPKVWRNNRQTKEYVGLQSAPVTCLKRTATTVFAEVLE